MSLRKHHGARGLDVTLPEKTGDQTQPAPRVGIVTESLRGINR